MTSSRSTAPVAPQQRLVSRLVLHLGKICYFSGPHSCHGTAKKRMNSIFITGAGAGIGLATARLFAHKGWFVGCADRDEAALGSLQEEIGVERCSTHTLDVVNVESVQQALAEFATRTGGYLQVLHNNAGVLEVSSFEGIELADHRRIIEVNVIGLINVLHAAFP